VSTHSDNRENLLTITPESVLTMRRNRCSRSFRMSAHDGVEYASEGYVRGARVDQPAVISVNMVATSTAINEFLARVHPFRVSPNCDFAVRRISLSDHVAGMDEQDGEPCAVFGRYVGLGDQEPLLGVIGLQ